MACDLGGPVVILAPRATCDDALATAATRSQSCFGMPAFSMTADHLAMSFFMRAVISSGVLARISMPSLLALSCTSEQGSTSLMARLSPSRRLGRRGRHRDAVPAHHLVVLDAALLDGRHVGQIGGAPRPVDASATTFCRKSAPAARHRTRTRFEVAAQDRAAMSAEVRNGTIFTLTPAVLEQLGGEVLRAAGIDGADVELAGIGAGRRRRRPAAI